jgi:hypothetical protein
MLREPQRPPKKTVNMRKFRTLRLSITKTLGVLDSQTIGILKSTLKEFLVD